MVTFDEYYAAQKQRDSARAGLQAVAQHLHRFVATLTNPRGVRLNDITTYSGPDPGHVVVDHDDLVQQDRIEAAVRAFTQSCDNFNRIDASLTAGQRAQLRR